MAEIIKSPNEVLLEDCIDCSKNDKSLSRTISQLKKLMYKNYGIGLAAPQIGVSQRVIVVDTNYDAEDRESKKNPIVLINPKIIDKSSEKEESEEGCLSCPGITASVLRYKFVRVEYNDEKWNTKFIDAYDLMSHCLQHEIDHLDGKTILQTAKPEIRLNLLNEYQTVNAQ